MNKTREIVLSEKLQKLDEYEILLENSTTTGEVNQLIGKIKKLLAEIEILEKSNIQTGLSYIPIKDGNITGNRGLYDRGNYLTNDLR